MTRKTQSGVSRRTFLAATAATGVGLTVAIFLNRRSDETHVTAVTPADSVDVEWDPQAFVRVGYDDRVTVISKHTEMGQGVYTGLATIVAVEMGARWEQMRVESAPVNTALYTNFSWGSEQATGGSSSLGNSFDQLRQVAAATREMLLGAAAADWGVPIDEVHAAEGEVRHLLSGKSAGFGELAQLAANQPVPEAVPLKPIESFAATDDGPVRIDIDGKVDGSALYTQDIQLPDMQVAVVAHPPRFGGKVSAFDDGKARTVSGVSNVIEIPSGVAVLASNFWSASKARDLLDIDWDDSAALTESSDVLVEQFKAMAATDGAIARDEGNYADNLAAAHIVVDTEYAFPMLAHAPIEPQNCVVHWSNDGCRIWSGTQQQTMDQAHAAEILGLSPEKVEIETQFAGGGFGRRASDDYIREALYIAKALGPGSVPVKLMWTREDDMKAGMYRPLNYHRLRAGLDTSGKVIAWHHSLVGQSIALQTRPVWFVDGVDNMSVQGANDWLYGIGNVRVETHAPELPIPVLWYRGVGATHTVYSVETFIDELAETAGRDPLQFRLDMLKAQPRMAAVASLAAEKSNWGETLPANTGRGISICKQRNTYLAQVAEVSVNADGAYSVDRVVTAIDCGTVLNPDVVTAQMEGGTGFGLSSATRDAVTLRDGYVEQENFDKYPILRINQMPRVDVHIVQSNDPPSGVGELAPITVGAAVANALSSITGKRYRSLPIAGAA